MSFQTEFEHYLSDLCAQLGHKSRHASFLDYERGLMLPIERKSVEPIAAHIDPDNVSSAHQSLHHFVSTSPWSDRKVLDRITEHVLEVMDCSGDLYWMIDDTGMPKKGKHSVGVSHQYCGQLGKQANCQVAVSLSVANDEASVPVDYQLYLPKGWAEDKNRRADVGVPEEIEFQTKPTIALAQIAAACERELPRGIVLADSAYGSETSFREGLEALELTYSVGVKSSTSVWAPGVEPLPPKSWSGRGRRPSNMRLAKGHAPVSCEQLASELPSGSWRYIEWREGTNAVLRSRFAAVRVRAAHRDQWRSERREEQWLLIEWPEGEEAPSKFWLSNLPASTTRAELVNVTKMRWRIERDYQELKQEFGLNHYEGRNWRGFHHHATLCIAAYAFLVIQRLKYPTRKKNRLKRTLPPLPESYVPRGAAQDAATC